jgi:ABC-2 type transporter
VSEWVRSGERAPKTLSHIVRLPLQIFWSVVFGTVFLRLGHDQVDIGLRQGLVYNLISSMGLTTNRNIAETFADRPVFTIQRKERYYATLPFFLSNLITYIPIILADVLFFITPAYWLANLNSSFDRFVYIILIGWFSPVCCAVCPAHTCVVWCVCIG